MFFAAYTHIQRTKSRTNLGSIAVDILFDIIMTK